MSDTAVEVIVTGFAVLDPTLDVGEAEEVAYALACDIGMRLSELGRESLHGQVVIRYPGVEAHS